MSQSDNQGFRINKEINVGEIVTFLSAIALVVIFLFDIDKRVDNNTTINTQQDTDIKRNAENINKITGGMDSLRLETKSDLQRLESNINQAMIEQGAKMDRIYDFIIKQQSNRSP